MQDTVSKGSTGAPVGGSGLSAGGSGVTAGGSGAVTGGSDAVIKALSRMMAACSRRECCISEIRAKLERGWGSRSGCGSGCGSGSGSGSGSKRIASGHRVLSAGRSAERSGLSTGRSASALSEQQTLSAGQIEEIIERLCREKFIDERRYASAFARDRSSLQGWGTIRIRRALSMKGISSEDIASALESIDTASADSRMESLLSAKLRSLRSCDDHQARRIKLLRYGLSRGYSYDQILEFLNSASNSSME